MRPYRSRTTMDGDNRAGARALWRATGMSEADLGKPIVAIANSFTQFVPGHVHLKDLGQLVAREIEAAGANAKEFNTIAVDDGIAMGHDGMLYSLPSRELIADCIEYMVEAHCADALVCISNCDKITPGMLMAAMRLNIPTIFVSGGPMEAGKVVAGDTVRAVDAIDAMVDGQSPDLSAAEKLAVEQAACPTCGSCSGMFTANSMNCLVEAIGLALPGNGTVLATHADREALFREAGRRIVELTRRYYVEDDDGVLPRYIADKASFKNAMTLDIAMGGSTNTILHLLAAAQEGEIDFTLTDIDRLSREVPHLCKLSPSTPDFHIEDVHRAGGIMAILGELERMGLIDRSRPTVHAPNLGEALEEWDVMRNPSAEVDTFYRAAPGGRRTVEAFSQDARYETLDLDRANGCIRDLAHAYSPDGGLAVLFGNLAPEGCVVKTAGVPDGMTPFSGPARVFESESDTVAGILSGAVQPGDVVVVRYEGPKGGPGMQEMLHPTSFLRSMKLNTTCAIVTDGRFSGGSSGLSIGHISPEAAAGGLIGLVQDGDTIAIDIANRRLDLKVAEDELKRRRQAMQAQNGAAWRPVQDRPRKVSRALKAYALLASSASAGAVRQLPEA